MRVTDCRAAWKHAYMLVSLLYYINQSKLDDLLDVQIAAVEYAYQQVGVALNIGGTNERYQER